jgi:hypothetical protein
MSDNLKFIAILVALILMMLALAYLVTPRESRLALPSSNALLKP